jgi:uncharacterized membrane protein YuzA (DUF378 family)
VNSQLDAAIATGASKATQVGATTSVVSWLLSSEFGMIAGLVIGLAGLSTNLYFAKKRDRREQAEHEARMRALR